MIRLILPTILGIGLAAFVLGMAYQLGVIKGRHRGDRWADIVSELFEWRQLELMGMEDHARTRLDSVRKVLDNEEDMLRKELRQL